MHHNPTHPAVKLTLDGVTYLLRFDFNAIAQAEDIADRPLLTGLRTKDVSSPKISLVRAMLFAAMLPDQPQIAYDDVKSLVNQQNLVEVWTHVLKAWANSSAEPDPEAVESDPQKDRS